eukprot:m.436988 g.436988  ORF g.436988 m.436988 type:complete len:186 (+) comp18046_c0_seq1:282-839(+)
MRFPCDAYTATADDSGWGSEHADDSMNIDGELERTMSTPQSSGSGWGGKMTPPRSPKTTFGAFGSGSSMEGSGQFSPFRKSNGFGFHSPHFPQKLRGTPRSPLGHHYGSDPSLNNHSTAPSAAPLEVPENGIPTPTRMDSPSSPRKTLFSQSDLDTAFMTNGALDKLSSMDVGEMRWDVPFEGIR